MHVLLQLLQSLVVALAAACLAHFGLALKEPPQGQSATPMVQRLPVATPATRPCPHREALKAV